MPARPLARLDRVLRAVPRHLATRDAGSINAIVEIARLVASRLKQQQRRPLHTRLSPIDRESPAGRPACGVHAPAVAHHPQRFPPFDPVAPDRWMIYS
jgi:hypothetical protein